MTDFMQFMFSLFVKFTVALIKRETRYSFHHVRLNLALPWFSRMVIDSELYRHLNFAEFPAKDTNSPFLIVFTLCFPSTATLTSPNIKHIGTAHDKMPCCLNSVAW